MSEEESVEDMWIQCRDTLTGTCEQLLGYREVKRKDWITDDTWKAIEERRAINHRCNRESESTKKEELRQEYKQKNRAVKKKTKQDRKSYIDELASEAEVAAKQHNPKELYKITKQLAGTNRSTNRPVKNKQGNLPTKESQQMERWRAHFQELLNRPPPDVPPDVLEPTEDLQVNCGRIPKEETKRAIKKLRLGKAPGFDNIPPDILKTDVSATTELLYGLINKIWDPEEIPLEWKTGLLVKLPKKGNLSECKNWRGIMLLSIPSKVLCRIILDRIQGALNKLLRKEQAGFRRDKSCTVHIATLRIIVEQCVEWQSPLCINFVDFEKAFDSLDRVTLWKPLRYYGLPNKFINIIRNMYDGFSGQVICEGKLSAGFSIKTGVRQGCLLSPLIFPIAIDWAMRKTTEHQRTGIQWTLFTQIEDLDFADDLALVSESHRHMQQKTERLQVNSGLLGLRINTGKTKVMKANSRSCDPIIVNGEAIEEVQDFTYLGSNISRDGGAERDVELRIGKARQASRILRPIWLSSQLSTNTKIRIFNTNVNSVLLYGSEPWKSTE